MKENLIAFKDSENKERLYDSTRNLNYHGVTLVASPGASVDNAYSLYEPAYGIRIMDEPGKGLFKFNENAEKKETEKAVGKFLDEESKKLESCQEEGNYLGQIAFDIIANNKEVKNKEYNKPFQEKVENLRKNVMEKLKKGVAITVAFAACACFAPKLAAQAKAPVTFVRTSIARYENPVDFYKTEKAVRVVGIKEFQHDINEEAKRTIKEDYPKLSESSKKYAGLLKEAVIGLCESDTYLNKYGMSHMQIDDHNNDYAAIFNTDTRILVTADCAEYKAMVKNKEIEPSLELHQEVSKKKAVDAGRSI